MSVVAVRAVGPDRGDGQHRPARPDGRRGHRRASAGAASSTGSGPKRTLMIVLASWAVGLVVGGDLAGGPGAARARRCSSSPGRSSGAASAASRSPTGCSWSGSRRRSGSASSSASTGWSARARRSSASCCTALIAPALPRRASANGAYQLAVLSLLVTMLIGRLAAAAGHATSGRAPARSPTASRAAGAPRPGDRAARAALGRPLSRA